MLEVFNKRKKLHYIKKHVKTLKILYKFLEAFSEILIKSIKPTVNSD